MNKIEEYLNTLNLDEEQKEYLEMIKQDFGKFKYNKDTFFCSTIANFKEVENEEILNKMKNNDVDFQSNSDSKYIYIKEGVYRYSNHWNKGVASCSWFLDNKEVDELKLGFCKWSDFIPNNFRLTIYAKNIELMEKYARVEKLDISKKFVYGRCFNYYKYFVKDNFGTGVKIENKIRYDFAHDQSIII